MTANLKLHHLRHFVAIAQHQSVRSAARALGLAQPAVTRSLSELEKELKASLVERHSRGVVLTEVGKRFLIRAQSAVSEVQRAAEEVEQLSGSGRGTVVAALSIAAMLALAAPAINAFRKSYPAAHLRVMEGVFPMMESRLLDGQLDFYVGARPVHLPRELRSEFFFHNERMVVGRKGHPLRKAKSLGELVQADWVLTGLRDKEEAEFEELFSAHKLATPGSRIRVESVIGLMMLMSTSDALVLLPRQWTDLPLFQGVIAPIAIQEKLAAPDIVLIARSSVPLTPIADRFAVLLQRAAGHSFS